MPLPHYNDLMSVIETFNTKYKRPAMTLKIGDQFDLHKHYNDLETWYIKKVGVYILLNEDKNVIRIGSTTNDLYERLNTYFDYLDDAKTKGIGWWKEGVSSRYIHIIEVPKEQDFEALAIEKYLLDELKPPLNKEGKEDHIEYRQKVAKELEGLRDTYKWTECIEKWQTL